MVPDRSMTIKLNSDFQHVLTTYLFIATYIMEVMLE